jgi:hypothetical protein
MMTFVTGLIGIAMMAVFLGFMVWWLKEWPLTIIVLIAMALLVYDFVRTLRYGENGGGR